MKHIDLNKKLTWQLFATIVSLIFMMVASITTLWNLNPWLWGIAFFVGGLAKAIEGVQKTIEEKALNVEFLMIAAALAAFFTGEYAEGAVLIFIFAVSGVLEEYATAQTEKALTGLLKIAPKTAILVQDGVEKIVEITALGIGNHVLVKPGQQIPADGEVFKGGASVDQSSITGEFNPVEKNVGDDVFAGSLVTDSSLEIIVTKDPSESIVQKMIALVKRAQEEKTKTEKRISEFEKLYVYFVILLSLFVIFITPIIGWLSTDEAFRRGVIVLVVASPCALVASISPALLSTLSHSAKKGILIKSGKYIDILRSIRVVAFDKTGTLTTGKPIVHGVYFSTKDAEQKCMPLVVNAERQSNHPLAKALVKHFSTMPNLNVVTKEVPGRGLEVEHEGMNLQIGKFPYQSDETITSQLHDSISKGFSIVSIVCDGHLKGFITLQDTVREEAKKAIQELRLLNIEPVMITGDNAQTAKAIALAMNINTVHSDCLPVDKVRVVEAYQRQGTKVLMIGDGINDAPSLATATLGVAMGDGTDVSLETADMIVMTNKLERIPYVIRLSKRTRHIILQNVIFSIGVMTTLLIINLFGLIVLRFGVIGHEVSTVLVILNSLRLLNFKKR